MSIVKIDTNKIGTTLSPLAKTARSQNQAARNSAGSVDFPNGEFDWYSVCAQIDECTESLGKYSSWLSTVQNQYNRNIQNGVDSINSINVSDITISGMSVK